MSIDNMVIVRLSKVIAVFAVGLYFLAVVINNTVDYDTNFSFVEHVLKMDTLPPSHLSMSRAIHASWIHHLIYRAIIGFEILTCFLCLFGGYHLLFKLNQTAIIFSKNKSIAASGLMMGFLLMVFGFMTIGGEWFLIWQSQTLNSSLLAALRVALISGLVFLFLLQPEAEIGK